MNARNINDLFAEQLTELVKAAPPTAEHQHMAERLSPLLQLGTATWSYPGWAQAVWQHGNYEPKLLSRYGLSAYSQHPLLDAAEIDHSWYKPPTQRQYQEYASQLPAGFSVLAKTFRDITLPGSSVYLNAEYFRQHCLLPFTAGLADNSGPLLLAFQAGATPGKIENFLAQLKEFFSEIPGDEILRAHLTLEIREPALLMGRYRENYNHLLNEYGIAHSFIHHPSMPSIAQQARALAGVHQPWLVVRWMLRHGLTHEEARRQYSPFNSIRAEDEPTRRVIVTLAKKAIASKRRAWIIAGNKAEGCAPQSLFNIAGSLADARQ